MNKNHPFDHIDQFVDFSKMAVRKIAEKIIDQAIVMYVIRDTERDNFIDTFMEEYRIDPFDKNCILIHTKNDWIIHISEVMYATSLDHKIGLVYSTRNKTHFCELRIYNWLTLGDA